jgi:DNA-binding IclR family transcriptional regulator
VLFAVPDADLVAMTYVDVIESRNAVRFAVAVGDRRPLYATAGGRMLLAARSEDAVRAYLAQLQPERLTATAETDKARLALAIAEARAAAVAQTVDQAADGVTGTAALIHDAGGHASGALVVAAPSARSQDRLAELRRLVRAEAGVISRSLGWRDHA